MTDNIENLATILEGNAQALRNVSPPLDGSRAEVVEHAAKTMEEAARVLRDSKATETCPGGHTREEWEVIAKNSFERSAHLPED